LNNLITPDEKHLKKIKRIDDYFASLILPRNVDGSDPDNLLIKRRKEFEAICVGLKTNGIANPKNLSIFEFFATIEEFEKRKRKSNTPNK
jgi:hypothetical protein